jgi:hypothetical protein
MDKHYPLGCMRAPFIGDDPPHARPLCGVKESKLNRHLIAAGGADQDVDVAKKRGKRLNGIPVDVCFANFDALRPERLEDWLVGRAAHDRNSLYWTRLVIG